ncbi:hypothetical protein [Streptomyces sp. NPDC058739]|uniref:hypothetical protein n=1 Tax=Streptomyces sp. NPDC058739 TaxID=3346618 RepID=UPI0036B809EC
MNPPPTQQDTDPPQIASGPLPETSAAQDEHDPQPYPVSAGVLLPLVVEPETPRYLWETMLPTNEASGPRARLRVHPHLSVARRSGDIDAVGQIRAKLADNAARHGKPFSDGCLGLRLPVVPETEELRIEIDDADPALPGFDTAASVSHPHSRGLWWARHYKDRLSWDVKLDDDGRVTGKTVTAVLRPAGETGLA